jgi:hypothetical protein
MRPRIQVVLAAVVPIAAGIAGAADVVGAGTTDVADALATAGMAVEDINSIAAHQPKSVTGP